MAGEVFMKRYEALRLLGEGGMGRVFLGRQLDNHRQVVIKVMHDQIAANPRFRQSFAREMKLMTHFRHPYAVALYDACLEDGRKPCIIMEYVPGVTLDALVQKNGRLNPVRAGLLLGQLCQVLQAAHQGGITHRDLTPVNIMVMNPDSPQEAVKVMDFGLARMGAGPYIPLEKLTGNQQSIGGGTPDYVSPEQVRGEETDHRADLYSVGVVLYKVLTGYLPFEHATTPADILQAHLNLAPPSFAAMGAGDWAPPALEEVVQNCLAKFPNERPADALDLARRFETALGRKIMTGGDVATPTPLPLSRERIDPRKVLDRVEAWMPEPIAVVKLRGFAHDLGGEIVESEPGLIKVRLRDPGSPPDAGSKSLFTRLGLGGKPRAQAQHALLELHMEKKTAGQRSMILLSVILQPQENPLRACNEDFKAWGTRVCRDLRAYLIGR